MILSRGGGDKVRQCYRYAHFKCDTLYRDANHYWRLIIVFKLTEFADNWLSSQLVTTTGYEVHVIRAINAYGSFNILENKDDTYNRRIQALSEQSIIVQDTLCHSRAAYAFWCQP